MVNRISSLSSIWVILPVPCQDPRKKITVYLPSSPWTKNKLSICLLIISSKSKITILPKKECPTTIQQKKTTSWWFQTIWKYYCSQIGSFSQGLGWKQKIFETIKKQFPRNLPRLPTTLEALISRRGMIARSWPGSTRSRNPIDATRIYMEDIYIYMPGTQMTSIIEGTQPPPKKKQGRISNQNKGHQRVPGISERQIHEPISSFACLPQQVLVKRKKNIRKMASK